MTDILPADAPEAIQIAADALQQGKVIGLPTDTVYGVAALALNRHAVAEIYRLKRRPAHKAIPVFVPSIAQLSQVCTGVPQNVMPLLTAFLPGALTVILPAHPSLPGIVTNFGDTVAVRIPDHPVALALLARVNAPLAVTSANISDHPTPPTAAAVAAQLGEALPLILDGGISPQNTPSTILDVTQSPPKILRHGAIPAAALARYLKTITV